MLHCRNRAVPSPALNSMNEATIQCSTPSLFWIFLIKRKWKNNLTREEFCSGHSIQCRSVGISETDKTENKKRKQSKHWDKGCDCDIFQITVNPQKHQGDEKELIRRPGGNIFNLLRKLICTSCLFYFCHLHIVYRAARGSILSP